MTGLKQGKTGGSGGKGMSNWTTPEEEVSTGRVIAAALAVHRSLGPGYLESISHRALSIELGLRGITHACEIEVEIGYAGVSVDTVWT
jgi:GxxExxY protein